MSQNRPATALASAPTVLVVEDDDVMRELVVDTLERDGFLVLAATSAVEAEALLTPPRSPHIDLVLTDVRMAGLNGLDLGKKLRELRRDMPMILMTAFPEPDVYVAAADLDAAVLAKPFHLESLRRAVLTTIAAYVKRREPRLRDGDGDG